MLGLILQETLQAFRAERDFSRAAKALATFPLLQLSRTDYVEAARLHRTCRSSGVVTSTADCQIAAAAMLNKCALLAVDDDFRVMATLSKLKLVRF